MICAHRVGCRLIAVALQQSGELLFHAVYKPRTVEHKSGIQLHKVCPCTNLVVGVLSTLHTAYTYQHNSAPGQTIHISKHFCAHLPQRKPAEPTSFASVLADEVLRSGHSCVRYNEPVDSKLQHYFSDISLVRIAQIGGNLQHDWRAESQLIPRSKNRP